MERNQGATNSDRGAGLHLATAAATEKIGPSSGGGLPAEGRTRPLQERCSPLVGRGKDRRKTDPVSGLGNRAWFMEASRTELERIRRDGGRIAVAVIDIDGLKRVNDDLGHSAGDQVLRRVASTIERVVRRSDIVARRGGDQFVLLLTDADQRGAMCAAERIRSAVAAQVVPVAERDVRCTVSTGVAEVDPLAEDVEASLWKADEALYRAKNEGRNKAAGCGLRTRGTTADDALDYVAFEPLPSAVFV